MGFEFVPCSCSFGLMPVVLVFDCGPVVPELSTEPSGLVLALVLVLVFASAVPAGPGELKAVSVTVDGEVPELRFMEGTMRARHGIRTEVHVSPVSEDAHSALV